MQSSILLSSGADIDIMVHGLFSYELFGQTFWITTTHVSLLIVMAILIGFSVAANRAMKHASEVPGGFQNVVELIVEKYNFENYFDTVMRMRGRIVEEQLY